MSLVSVTVNGTVTDETQTPVVGASVQWSLTQAVVDSSGGDLITAASKRSNIVPIVTPPAGDVPA